MCDIAFEKTVEHDPRLPMWPVGAKRHEYHPVAVRGSCFHDPC